MTYDQYEFRLVQYRRAYLEGRITWQEWQGFVEALQSLYNEGE
jgi:hypothetical protein